MAHILDEYRLRNFSFPLGAVTLSTKAAASSAYDTCRTIEPGINRDPVDLGFLRANRVYSHAGMGPVKELISHITEDNGWLILYTHDVERGHSVYGCTPEDFDEVVRCAVASGAELLPVAEAAKRFTVGC